jgi:transglutaminase-like putative cysteine protease
MKMIIPKALLKNQITLSAIPDGVDGIKATLALMVRLAQNSKNSFVVREKAMELVSDVPQKSYFNEIKAVHEFVRDHIRYTMDINEVETISTPEKTLSYGQGDCDDKALLAAALLEALGHPARFVAVGSQPGDFTHVLVETLMYMKGGTSKWIPVETTEPVPVGWYPTGMPYRLVYNI